ncbi:hypothetical protein kac65v162_gp158 [Nodularia phage vB_NspS-kac65v162]|jgi:hypothetical protein|uniref:Uncharacterized protein n=5 Tax=Ravarandavirus TaxID=2843444 RepID=A0A482MLW7_9CAUD|nr:hypothetical protein HWC12_gp159 [Nodularia phage vB_NspS-kac65v151]YP_009844973.1 hypothetical protein HWC13_gp147 [Nodularia phage vB_NspS-kac68v161]QBQ73396.1 hypothetical protein kac65v161_gp158 [Nodularia phage vB_NspS-kac65v161]QBQ73602.1 hypothetical protein kac65v162_gp158 [Nodularia phage vB_NspS-kac65v162]QBQ74010.1 hypothetical protein kac68v162_gp162 [Nodularia phage vB_NspS-kac68v162]QBQ73188.1 hypothetical protein kac65v151_gp158 [Nodularia phage vB_NspS-kac65v151]QBQ73814.1 
MKVIPPAWEFENGVILVPGVSTCDWFFDSRDNIEPCGNGIVTGVKETEVEEDYSVELLQEAIENSELEWGYDSVPKEVRDLIK